MAIGPTTAILVEELLASPSYLPDSGMSSEDLLSLEILQQVEGMKIGIFRGKGGRELLAETLKNRGALVDYLEVYQRQPINYDEGEFCDSLRQTGVTSLTVSSGESLQLLSKLLLSGDNKRDFSLLPLLVPSNRVAQQANDLGFTNVILCKGADSQSMIEALESLETKKVNQ
jgi:uroporphyrinogen-III synthase